MPRRLDDAELEKLMIQRITEALYPVLIPVEQQDCQIQAQNRAIIEAVALNTWRRFSALCQ